MDDLIDEVSTLLRSGGGAAWRSLQRHRTAGCMPRTCYVDRLPELRMPP